MLALGQSLLAAGYTVRIAADRTFETLCKEIGAGFFRLSGSVREFMTAAGTAMPAGGINPLTLPLTIRRRFKTLIPQLMRDSLAAAQGADLLISGTLAAYFALSVAEKQGVPCLTTWLQPGLPTSAFSSPFLPFSGDRKKQFGASVVNRGSHLLAEQLFWQLFRSHINRARRKILGLPAFPVGGPFSEIRQKGQPILCAFSPHIVKRPPDWPANIHQCGYWFLKNESVQRLPDELLDFLNGGEKPIAIGFGSMTFRNPAKLFEMFSEALRKVGQRAVWISGWGSGAVPRGYPQVFQTGPLAHHLLFPRVKAVIHHGGAGTTAAALRAGKPSIIIPFHGDQLFWGQRIAALGAGPGPLPFKKLTTERIYGTIRMLLESRSMAARAESIGDKIRREDGLAPALKIIGGYFQE